MAGPGASAPSTGGRGAAEQRREKLRHWIRIASLAMLAIYLLRFFVNMALSYQDNSFSVPFALGVAYCGIVGAQRMHPFVLTCFYTCCMASVCIYVISAMLQTREIVLLRQDELTNSSAVDSQGHTLAQQQQQLYVAIIMETVLMVVQCSAAQWGRELVRDHIVVEMPSHQAVYGPGAFTFEFVQEQPGAHGPAGRGGVSDEDRRATVASIPVTEYAPPHKPVRRGGGGGGGGSGMTTIELSSVPTMMPVSTDSAPNSAVSQDEEDDDDELCVICQDDLRAGDRVKVLACKHIYHADCLNQWLARNLACPMCMAPVPVVHVATPVSPVQPAASAVPPPLPPSARLTPQHSIIII